MATEAEAEVAVETVKRPPVPKAAPHWRTIPGQIGEWDSAGNMRGHDARLAAVDPAQCTSGGGKFAGGPKGEILPPGYWRDSCNLLRNAAGELATLAPAEPSGPIVSPQHSSAVEQAINYLDAAFPVAPKSPPDAA